MAKKQSILSRILPRAIDPSRQSAELLDILHVLDQELHFDRGIPDDGKLNVLFPEYLRLVFVRAQEALQQAKEAYHG